jgi:hypothetical protein
VREGALQTVGAVTEVENLLPQAKLRLEEYDLQRTKRPGAEKLMQINIVRVMDGI